MKYGVQCDLTVECCVGRRIYVAWATERQKGMYQNKTPLYRFIDSLQDVSGVYSTHSPVGPLAYYLVLFSSTLDRTPKGITRDV